MRSLILLLLVVFTVIGGALGCEDSSAGGPIGGARPVSINLTPPGLSIAAGTSSEIKAIVVFDNQSTRDVTANAAWTSSDNAIATVIGGKVTGIKAGTATITAAGEGQTRQAQVLVTPATLVSIALTPPTPSVAKGLKTQLVATGKFSDNTTQDLSTQVAWSSSAPAIATVDAKGLVSTLAVGPATITAGLKSISGSTIVTVTNATLVSIELTPPAPTVPKGLTKQMVATGIFTDQSKQDLTSQASWASTNPETASVDQTGLARAKVVGPATLSATVMGITGKTVLTVSNAELVSIGVTPATPSKAKGLTQQFTATGVFTDTSTHDLTTQVAWTTSDALIADLSNAAGTNGLAFTLGLGTATVTATLGVISGNTTITVTEATLVSIGVTPATPSKAKGLTQQFTATGKYTDNSTQDLTTTVTWSSSDESDVIVSNAAGSKGLASTPGIGTATVTATLGPVSGSTTFTVTAATLVSIAVTPPSPSKAKGLTQQFTATGTYTDNSTQNLTAVALWESSDTNTVTINNAGSPGLASTPGLGSVTIKATSGGISGSTTFTVTAATLVSIGVTPSNSFKAKGLQQQFTATGTFTDNTVQNLTTTATWESSDITKVTISNAAASKGLASTPAVGTVTITATSNGISGSTQFTVTAADLVSIAVTPANSSTAKGLTRQFTATGTYTDNSVQNLTSSVTWASSGAAVTISNAAADKGLASTPGTGTVNISATLNAIVGSTPFTVTAKELVSIGVTPANTSKPKGSTEQFVAMGVYTDLTTEVLTGAVTWSVTGGAGVVISNAADPPKGSVTTPGLGTVNIVATLGAISGTTKFTVTAAELVTLTITPDNGSIALGLPQQFTATGTYTDNSVLNLTSSATWSAAPSGIITISNAAGTQGRATTDAKGTVTVTATIPGVGGKTDTTQFTVTDATLVSIAVTSPDSSVPKGTPQQFKAEGTYTNGSKTDLTLSVLWASSDSNIVNISNTAPPGKGSATTDGSAIGTVNITATLSGVTGTKSFTVTAAQLLSIDVTPKTQTVPAGTNVQYKAEGTYTDGKRTITTLVTWTPSGGGEQPVSVSNDVNNSKGLAATYFQTEVPETITATLDGVSGSTTLTVTAPEFISLVISPAPTLTIDSNETQQFTATVTYTDGSFPVTSFAEWASDSNSMYFDPFKLGAGVGVAQDPGTAMVTATYDGHTSSPTTVTVVDPPRFVFVSSALYNGNMGGLVGADQKCQALAGAANLTGTYKAWLSGSGSFDSPASGRFIQSSKPYVRTDGVQIAANFSALVGTGPNGVPLSAAINKNERGLPGPTSGIVIQGKGGPVPGNFVHTNTSAAGYDYGSQFEAPGQYSCSDWTSADVASPGVVGDTLLSDEGWTQANGGATCGQLGPIYCFRQVREFNRIIFLPDGGRDQIIGKQ